MPIKLHVVKGVEPGQVLVVPDEGALIIGRAKTADVCLDDKLLSRQHVRVESRKGTAVLTDLASSNGTYVNGEKVKESRLSSGDKIKIGAHVFHVEIGEGITGADGSAAAAAGALGALEPPKKRDLVFCSKCHRASTTDESVEMPGEGWYCSECADGQPFPETMIEGFKIISKLGDGRLGPVFKAKHQALLKHVTIKIIRAERAVDENVLRRFMREAKIGGRLFHPNILEMYDAAASGGHYYVTMEWLDGLSLEEKIVQGGPLAPSEVVKIAGRMADALGYAHTQKIIHRDVRPANVHLGKKGDIKLGGFGLARPIAELVETLGEVTPLSEGKGTLPYIPPEQITDARGADPRSDIYSLGATLYHAIVGAAPFEAATLGETLNAVVAGRFRTLDQAAPTCPPDLAAIVHYAMNHDRAHRFQSGAELLQVLRALPYYSE